MPSYPQQSALLDTAAVARLLGVAPSTVRAYVARAQMPAPDHRLGGASVWDRETVVAWQAQRRGRGWRKSA